MRYFMRPILALAACVLFLFWGTPAPAFWGQGHIPKAADNIGEQLDKQLLARVHVSTITDTTGGTSSKQDIRGRFSVMSTVVVDINNLQVTCPMGRQMSEEVIRFLSSRGYRIQELRKGKEIFFQQKQGEMVLTRNTRLLASRTATAELILAGTYVISPNQVRFSMRLIETSGNQVVAVGTATVPITEDTHALLHNAGSGTGVVAPSISTKLQ